MKERLYRSRKERVIGGVCGGLAEYFGIDPIIIRIVAVVLLFGHGVGLLAYIIMWIAVPEEPLEHYYARFKKAQGTEGEAKPEGDVYYTTPQNEFAGNAEYTPYAPKKHSGGYIFGAILIALGALFMLWQYIPDFDWKLFFPIVLIALGGLVIFSSLKK